MGFFRFLRGASPLQIEERGDGFYEAGEYGAAKLEYEKALERLTIKPAGDAGDRERLKEKVFQSREALARLHLETAENLMETGFWDEAEERLRLALDLTEDEELLPEIEKRLEALKGRISPAARREVEVFPEEEGTLPEEAEAGEEEYFMALCSTLSDEERRAYLGYGDAFRRGFVALNQGDFEGALEELSRAREETPDPAGFIPLELAIALLNVGRWEEARSLLEGFMEEHPESLRACHAMCEILWEEGAFDRALQILEYRLDKVDEPVALVLLRGETLYRAGRYREAEIFLREALERLGWEENIVRSLAKALEAMGENEKARNLYARIMEECRSCRRAPDPHVKRKYADLSLELNEVSTNIIEIYLSLAGEDPGNRSDYYMKVSRIYSMMGNRTESERFLGFSRESGDE